MEYTRTMRLTDALGYAESGLLTVSTADTLRHLLNAAIESERAHYEDCLESDRDKLFDEAFELGKVEAETEAETNMDRLAKRMYNAGFQDGETGADYMASFDTAIHSVVDKAKAA